MTGDSGAGGADPPPADVLWPDIAVHVELGGLLPRWCASSVHPEFGSVHGRGLSHKAAVRSLVRDIRRSRVRPRSHRLPT